MASGTQGRGNALPLWGNEKTMNMNPLILTNIQASPYFKVELYELKTYHEVVDEIYYKVSHLEPWEKGSRKTAGQTGMCGGVRGVGTGGIVSTAFCLLYKLFTLKLTRKQLNGLITHSDSPYIRGLGFMYIRYTQPPADLWEWFEAFLDDEEELDVKAGGGCVMAVGEMLRSFLTKLEWFSTLFPRIPVPIQKDMDARLKLRPRTMPAPPRPWGPVPAGDRRAGPARAAAAPTRRSQREKRRSCPRATDPGARGAPRATSSASWSASASGSSATATWSTTATGATSTGTAPATRSATRSERRSETRSERRSATRNGSANGRRSETRTGGSARGASARRAPSAAAGAAGASGAPSGAAASGPASGSAAGAAPAPRPRGAASGRPGRRTTGASGGRGRTGGGSTAGGRRSARGKRAAGSAPGGTATASSGAAGAATTARRAAAAASPPIISGGGGGGGSRVGG